MKKSFCVKSRNDLAPFLKELEEWDFKRPMKVETSEYTKSRSSEMNRLSHAWYSQIEDELFWNTGEAKRQCKLMIGVPLLRQADDEFNAWYTKIALREMTYENKLLLMDMVPVTSLMKVKTMAKYLDEVQKKYAEQGVVLESKA